MPEQPPEIQALTSPDIVTPSRPHRTVTPERWAAFITAIRKYGSLRIAARIASPHLKIPPHDGGQAGGVQTFNAYMERHPEARREFQAAMEEGIAKLEKLAHERCNMPDRRPILDRAGNVVAEDVRWESANKMLLRNLAKRDREWSERRDVSGEVKVNHNVTINPNGFTITARDIDLMTPADQDLYFALIDRLEAARALEKSGQPQLPPANIAIEVNPTESPAAEIVQGELDEH